MSKIEFEAGTVEEMKIIEAAQKIKKFCKARKGTEACMKCVLHQKCEGCVVGFDLPERWKV
ncbi:MAG: hypothetical protein MJ126_10245 [Lachnospiraceae bacterium]|nr:hypothetical protein [Lachnospiraceae bacterium]